MQFSKLLQKLQQTFKAREKAVKSTLSNQMLRLQATLLSSVQPSMVELQSKLEHDQTAAVSTELQQHAQEFRPNRRAHYTAVGNVEDLASLPSDSSGSVNVALMQRQHARAQEAQKHLEKDMLSVLKALYDKCTHHGLNIGDYVSK